MIFGIGRGFAEDQILIKVKLALSLDLDRGTAKSSPRDCKMTFNIGQGYAELQILKK